MKIGIITQYYNSSNYGGLLQAYALSTFLINQGYETEQICFNFYSKKRSSTSSLKVSLKHGRTLKNLLLFIKRISLDKPLSILFHANKKIATRKNSCKYFREKIIHHSKKIYDNDTIRECQEYDTLITGSDQVWLCNVKQFHPGFWLTFADEKIKKISYAASISMNAIPEELHNFIRNALSSFSAISVRERSDVSLIGDIIGPSKKIRCVLDPTFLLKRVEWEALCEKNPCHEQKYIFAYLLGSKKEDRAFIKNFAKKTGLKVVFVPYMQNQYKSCDNFFGDIQLYDVSPQLFLSLIRDATYVFTDSFHGTVFSNIFHIEYFVLKRHLDQSVNSMNSRLYTLLNMLNMQDRIISNASDYDSLLNMSKINFNHIDKVIEDERNKSIDFLLNSLES